MKNILGSFCLYNQISMFFICKNDKINDKINSLDKKIINLLSDNAYMTIPEIAKAVSKSEPTISRHLNVLISGNIIQRIGSRKNGYWKVLKTTF